MNQKKNDIQHINSKFKISKKFLEGNRIRSVGIVFLTPVMQQAFTHYRRYPPARLEPVTLFLRYLESTTLSLDEGTLSIFGARPLEEMDLLVKRSLCILLATSPRRVKPLKSRDNVSCAPHHCFFYSTILHIKISFEI